MLCHQCFLKHAQQHAQQDIQLSDGRLQINLNRKAEFAALFSCAIVKSSLLNPAVLRTAARTAARTAGFQKGTVEFNSSMDG